MTDLLAAIFVAFNYDIHSVVYSFESQNYKVNL